MATKKTSTKVKSNNQDEMKLLFAKLFRNAWELDLQVSLLKAEQAEVSHV